MAFSKNRASFLGRGWATWALVGSAAVGTGVYAAPQQPVPLQAPPPAQAPARCKVEGQVKSGTTPLPGASVLVHVGDALRGATSTDADGKFSILFTPNATYHLSAELTAFARVERDLTLAAAPCDTTIDFDLPLRPRTEPIEAPPPATTTTPTGQPAGQAQASATPPPTTPAPGRPATPSTPGQRTSAPAAARFQTLNVQTDANGAATLETAPPENAAELEKLLPPGFSLQSAQGDAVAINGSSDATNIDRGMMNDRFQALSNGAYDPTTGQFTAGPGGDAGGGQGGRGVGGPGGGGGGGRGGGPGGGGRGGGPGGFTLGGRAGRAQSPYQGSTNYQYGGSALNAAPFQLNPNVPVTQPQFSQNNFGGTFGGPVRIPGIYADTNRRTNFQFNYTGNQSNNLFDQYANVPTLAMRGGDFSSSTNALVNPKTGLPFLNNQIPTSAMDPGSVLLLQYMPKPNFDGGASNSNNYHVSTTAHTASNGISLRLTQNLSPTVTAGGRGGGGGGRGGGGGGRGGGRGGRGLTIMLSAQVQYRENSNQSLNVLSPLLDGTGKSRSISAPISLNISKGRTVQTFTVNVTQSRTTASNLFSNAIDGNIAGAAGIQYPSTALADPLNYGVPNVSFATFTGIRGPSANVRTDRRLTTSYVWSHPIQKHQLRIGADYRQDYSSSETNGNARGTFTYTGLYTTNGAQTAGGSGADFADFLLGMPQQATLQVGGVTKLHERSFDTYVEDNWQASSRLTFNLGLRYEVAFPYVEVNGNMANLDVNPSFTALSVVQPGGTGLFTGVFPPGLLNTDWNNVGPRVGFAYRLAKATILRGSYSITYNSGSYASIARQLVGQPPAAYAESVIGSLAAPLATDTALLSANSGTPNTYGVDRNYQLGKIQAWNTAVSRDLSKNWTVITSYTGTKGTNLDILRAPNRSATGLKVPTLPSFIWESSGGHSILQSGNFQLRRRLAHGWSGGVSYTLAKSMDNASSLGAGGAVVAQDDQNLGAEWALSNFDRRHSVSGDFLYELPFGPNRKWLTNGGVLAALVGEWSLSSTFTFQTGTPFTARISGATADVARGFAGSLRADYTGAPIQLVDPTTALFFNSAAFTVPAAGTYGDSLRNMIIGPSVHQLNASLSRDMRIGGNRAVSIQINALNLLNTVNWATIDTNFGSRTYGQVISVRPMRSITANVRFRF